jgi:hypothetical protein
MANSVPQVGKALPRLFGAARGALLDRRGGLGVIYAAVLAFIVLYVFSVKGLERVLNGHFQRAVAAAVTVDPMAGPITTQIQEGVDRVVRRSFWVRPGGVRVNVLVFGADGRTPLYVGGRSVAPPASSNDPMAAVREGEVLLPASIDVSVSVPHNALAANVILVGYAGLLIWGLFSYQRALARREAAEIERAVQVRDATAVRAAQIERELAQVRERLADALPTEAAQQEEIAQLQSDRESLQRQLAALESRERELRAEAHKSSDLDAERRTLEEMLDEALSDVSRRDEEIRSLEARLKRAAKEAPAPRLRESEQVERRLRALYKNLEIDDRAIDDLVALRDVDMQLKAEEAMKRLSDEPDTAAIRRKVGGLPPHLSIFEIGFAGKGRIYYTKGAVRRHRILSIGAKNSQKTDLEYLSRLA